MGMIVEVLVDGTHAVFLAGTHAVGTHAFGNPVDWGRRPRQVEVLIYSSSTFVRCLKYETL